MEQEHGFPQAEKLPDWQCWKREKVANDKNAGPIETPDGRVYMLKEEEKFILDPREPEGDKLPEAFIEVGGVRTPFEEWAKGKEQTMW